MLVSEKRCSRCAQVKSASDFSRHFGTRDNLQGMCKACRNEAKRQLRPKPRPKPRPKSRPQAVLPRLIAPVIPPAQGSVSPFAMLPKDRPEPPPRLERAGCTHYWVLLPPWGGESWGQCKFCGESKSFKTPTAVTYHFDIVEDEG